MLWFTTDQQRFDTIAALGNPHVLTPVMDSLVREGTAFTHAYCQAPVCTPSRSSFLTGMYPSSIRANRNGNAEFSNGAPLVTRQLADAGYFCGNVGKLHLASAHRGREKRVDDGYAHMDYSISPREDPGYDYTDWMHAQGASLDAYAIGDEPIPAELHQTRWCADRSIEFITENSGRPWVLTVNPFDPHPPFDPPADYMAMFDPETMPGPHFRESDLATQASLAAAGIDFPTSPRRPDVGEFNDEGMLARYRGAGAVGLEEDVKRLQAAYYAMIKLVDDELGRILEALAATGQRENTIIIFTSDHGEMLGDHGLVLKGPRFYEGAVRVPLIFNFPGTIPANQQSDALVELTDIAPTILDYCGITPSAPMQGRSLRPLAAGALDAEAHRQFVRCEYIDGIELKDPTRATMLRDARYKIIVYHGHDIGELYDLETDPNEFDNLWASPEHQSIKLSLMHRSFDAAMLALDTGPDRIAPW